MNHSQARPAGPLLVVSVSPGYGGAERSMEIILRHLPPGQQAAVLAESPLHLHALRQIARPSLHITAVASTNAAAFDRAVQRFIALYLQLRPSAVLANTGVSARILAAATRWLPGLGARSFIYVRDFLWQNLGQVLQPLAGATILVPHQVVLQRIGYLEPFVAPRGSLRALVVPDMVELPAPAATAPPPGGPLLHLATVNAWKGHTTLISAARMLLAAGTPVRIRSIGYRPDAALHATLEQQVAMAGLQGLVALEVFVPDPATELDACRAVVVASGTTGGGPETFGRAIIEAWAHARPVVAVAAGAPMALIRHEQDGLLVPEGDPAALAAALHRLATDDALCVRLGQAGLARARTEFAAGLVVPRLLAVLAGEGGAMPVPAGDPGVLLDLTRTLEHGWLTPMGIGRVEAEVFAALHARPELHLGLLRHDPAAGGFRPLDRAETEWVNQRFGVALPVLAGPGPMPPDGLRQRLRGLVGLAFYGTPRLLWRAMALAWRVARRLRRALPLRPAPPVPSAGPPPACLPAGRVLVSVANPWDYAAPSFFQAWRAGGLGVVVVVHDMLPWEVPQLTDGREVKGFIAQALAILAQANHLVACSAHSASSYAEAAADPTFRTTDEAVNPAPISIAHPGIAATLRRGGGHAAMPAELADGRPFIMFCSTIEIRKNHLLLLRVWDRLRRKMPEAELPRLVFVGRWGWGVEPVRIWVQRDWRLAQHVLVLEGVTDDTLALLYRRAQFTVFPSFAEGFGMPVAESLACGTPVLTGTHPALREAAEGLMPMIDPDDLAAWEGEILGLLQAPERLAALRAVAATYRGPVPGVLSRTVADAAAGLLQAGPPS